MSYPVPHHSPLGPMTDGKEIIISGHVKPDGKRITFGFLEHGKYEEGCPLVCDIRWNQNEIVRNTYSGSWGSEEKSGGLPVKKGEHLEMKFVVRNNEYQIWINNQHFTDYKHRVPKEKAVNLLVEGDINIDKIHISGGSAASTGGHGGVHQNPPVPFTVPISELHSGRKIVVEGQSSGRERFSIYLLAGSTINEDVVFVADIRFHYGSHNNVVVRNYKSGSSWGPEETQGSGFPFSPNTPFEIVIKVKENTLKLIVNDEKFATFHCHHIPLERAKYFSVQGDVSLSRVKV